MASVSMAARILDAALPRYAEPAGRAPAVAENVENGVLYHLCEKEAWLAAKARFEDYFPPTYREDGFIHCTASVTKLLDVFNHFYKDKKGEFLVLEIEARWLTAKVQFEAAMPVGKTRPPDSIASDNASTGVPFADVEDCPAQNEVARLCRAGGAGDAPHALPHSRFHPAAAELWPHVYGTINPAAVTRELPVFRASDGTFTRIGLDAPPVARVFPCGSPSSPDYGRAYVVAPADDVERRRGAFANKHEPGAPVEADPEVLVADASRLLQYANHWFRTKHGRFVAVEVETRTLEAAALRAEPKAAPAKGALPLFEAKALPFMRELRYAAPIPTAAIVRVLPLKRSDGERGDFLDAAWYVPHRHAVIPSGHPAGRASMRP